MLSPQISNKTSSFGFRIAYIWYLVHLLYSTSGTRPTTANLCQDCYTTLFPTKIFYVFRQNYLTHLKFSIIFKIFFADHVFIQSLLQINQDEKDEVWEGQGQKTQKEKTHQRNKIKIESSYRVVAVGTIL